MKIVYLTSNRRGNERWQAVRTYTTWTMRLNVTPNRGYPPGICAAMRTATLLFDALWKKGNFGVYKVDARGLTHKFKRTI